MELRIGYFPVLDAALALRQIHEFVRFQPYNPLMDTLASRFSPAERAQVDGVGEASRGWLWVIEALLEPGSAGLLGMEEGLLRLQRSPLVDGRLSDADRAAAGRALAHVLRTGLAAETSRRARPLLDATAAIHQGVETKGVWDYILGLSDRVHLGRNGDVVFRIKPEMRVRKEEVERIILMPSLVVTRRLTFWRSGSTMLFYTEAGSSATVDDPPDGLLLSALAVGDRTRLRMLRRLAEQPSTNLEMASFLGVNASTASRHFKLFKDAGFVEPREGDGGRMEYVLLPDGLATGLKAIIGFIEGGGK